MVLDHGAVLQDLRLEGHAHPLVLGYANPDDYLTDPNYFGATVGRCANRIGNSEFVLDGMTYQVDPNLAPHHLHGGREGIGRRRWQVTSTLPDRITLSIDLDDGEMGYPGAMTAECTFACLDGGILDIDITATAQAPTLCNLAHHSYWCLDDGPMTEAHVMELAADHITQVDENYISTGMLTDVTGTRFDFRAERPVADQTIIDNNLVLSRDRVALRHVGHLRSTRSGIKMTIATTEPGLQVYDANKLAAGAPGLAGQTYGPYAGIALEPQLWPDAINHEDFASPILRPGETYHQRTQFAFSKGDPS